MMNETKAATTYKELRLGGSGHDVAIRAAIAQLEDGEALDMDRLKADLNLPTPTPAPSEAGSGAWCMRCGGPVADGGRYCGEC